MKYLHLPVVLGFLLMTAMLPAKAITPVQKQQLSAELNQYTAYFQNQQYKEVIDRLHPKFWVALKNQAVLKNQTALPSNTNLMKSVMENILRLTFEAYRFQSVS